MENSESTSTPSFKKTFLYPIILALLLGSSSPWWWDKVFHKTDKPPVTDTAGVEPIDTTKHQVTTDPVATTTKNITVPINKFGVWGSSKASDNEMGTEKNKYWQAQCVTKLSKTESSISLRLTYRVWEDKKDHNKTRFYDNFDTIIYRPPTGKKILNINAAETPIHFEASEEGPNTALKNFTDIHGTYWENLSFRVDGPTHDDSKVIGVKGNLRLSITLGNR